MTQRTYKAAIIGLGFIGGGDQVSGDRIGQRVKDLDGHHREALTRNAAIELVAGCDVDAGRRERFERCTGARTYQHFQEMLDRERPELVSVAVCTPGHAPLTVAAAEAGARAIYCEKPIASSLGEARKMIDVCQRNNCLLVINHNRRFNPSFQQARKELAAGIIGDLTSLYLRWSAGRLGCTGTHLLDAARMLTGREIVGVSATLDLSDKPDCRGPEYDDPGGWGILRFEGNLMGVVNAANYNVGPVELTLDGSRGRMMTAGRLVEVQTFDGHTRRFEIEDPERTSMDRAVAKIVDWLDGKDVEIVSPDSSIRVLETIIGFHVSHARQAAWVELPLPAEHDDFCLNCG